MNCAKTSEIAEIPRVSTAIVMAAKKTSLPRMDNGVWLVWDLSTNFFMPPLRVHFKTPVRESEAKEHRAEMKETKVGYRYLHAHTESIAPSFENALLVRLRRSCYGRPIAAGLGTLHAAQSAADERCEERRDAAHYGRDAKTPRDAGRYCPREARRHGVGEGVREGSAQDTASHSDDDRDDKGQQRH